MSLNVTIVKMSSLSVCQKTYCLGLTVTFRCRKDVWIAIM